MEEVKIISTRRYYIKLYKQNIKLQDNNILNNIKAFNNNGELVWSIETLLKEYSTATNLNYHDEIFFDIIEISQSEIKAIGFYNHFIIDIDKMRIVKIINNR